MFAAGRELGGDDFEVSLQRGVVGRIGGQLRANREELALHPQDDGVPSAIANERARGAERGDRFVDVAVGLGTRVGLWHPPAVQQTRFSRISSPGDDALARDGQTSYAAPRASTSCDQCWRILRCDAKARGGNRSGRNQPTSCTSSPAAG